MWLVKQTPNQNLTNFDAFWNNFWRNSMANWENDSTTWEPRVDIKETKDAYELMADLPGLNKKDININVDDNVLSISGERKTETSKEGDNYHYEERAFGSFERRLQLPRNTDATKVKANYENGVLHVSIPKAEEAKPKQIEIN